MGVKVRTWKSAYWIFVDHQGRRKAKRVGTGKAGKKAAEQAAIKIQARLAEGDLRVFEPEPSAVLTFKGYAERWLSGGAGLGCQESTLEQYRHRLDTRL